MKILPFSKPSIVLGLPLLLFCEPFKFQTGEFETETEFEISSSL